MQRRWGIAQSEKMPKEMSDNEQLVHNAISGDDPFSFTQAEA